MSTDCDRRYGSVSMTTATAVTANVHCEDHMVPMQRQAPSHASYVHYFRILQTTSSSPSLCVHVYIYMYIVYGLYTCTTMYNM